MNSQSIFRVGGIAVILAVIISLASMAIPILLAVGALCMAVYIFALYRLFSAASPKLSLAVAVLGIVGSIVLAVQVLMFGIPNNALSNTATWAIFFLPPLIFGSLAYQHPEAGLQRGLALIGILGGVGGLVNLIVVLIGGGDWSNPNNPALSPLIMTSYYAGMLLVLVWMVWVGIVLLRRKV